MRRRTIGANDTEAVFTLSSSSQTYAYNNSGTYNLDVLRLDGLSPGSSALSKFSMTSSGSSGISGSLVSYSNKVVLRIILNDRTLVSGSISKTFTITYGSQSQVFTVTQNGDSITRSRPYWKGLSINLGTLSNPTVRKRTSSGGNNFLDIDYTLSASMSGKVCDRAVWKSGNTTISSGTSFNGTVTTKCYTEISIYLNSGSDTDISNVTWSAFSTGSNAYVNGINTRLETISVNYPGYELTDLGNNRYQIVTNKRVPYFWSYDGGSSLSCGSLENLECGDTTTRNNCAYPILTLVVDLSDASNPVVESTSVTWLPYS